MIQLPHLEADDLMGNLEKRFRSEVVYTYIGDIVVSVNPFKFTGNADPAVQARYVKALHMHEGPAALPPHVYCMVGMAYEKMRNSSNKSLSILISGESGAGKTEAMKLCVSHLGAVSATKGELSKDSVAARLMRTNPIMEPIGNAKTVRNNNSSRFGKHFDIQFDYNGQIVGALTTSYLLEKPRICQHMKGERNYHVFYMLCKADEATRAHGKLQNWERYAILKQPGTVETVTTWNDMEEFVAMHSALRELGFTVDHDGNDLRGQLYTMMSIVLQLGNVKFGPRDDDDGSVVTNPEQLALAAELMMVPVPKLRDTLTQVIVRFGNDEVTKENNPRKAMGARNSVCMHVYSLAFDWCVKMINATIAKPEGEVYRCIGVLDIFGFENFDLNSFPQLCINLTNERLHHLFIEHIFEVEQRFYESEDIEWTPVAYDDNKPIIDLIVKKPGIFALVNDAGKGGSTDDALLENMFAALDKAPFQGKTFSKPKRPHTFIIHHYAGDVSYNIEGFIEKNKDELSISIAALVEQHTQFDALKELALGFKKRMETAVLDKEAAREAAKEAKKTPLGARRAGAGATPRKAGGGPATRQKTVSESFGASLNLLLTKLSATEHNYIRCLKPNQTLRPGDWNKDLMLKQLAYSGTLEVTKVRKAGLNVRWELARFYSYYKTCAKDAKRIRGATMREQCLKLLLQIQLDPATWRVGKTLVFMASHDVLAELDRLRATRIAEYARFILYFWRMRKEQKHFQLQRRHARTLQHAFQGLRTAKAYMALRDATRVLQRAALKRLAHQRVEDVREDPNCLLDYVPDIDQSVNTKSGGEMSLTHSVAMAHLFPDASSVKELTQAERAQLANKRRRLADAPEELVELATDELLFVALYASLLWTKSGADVVAAGTHGVAKKREMPQIPSFPADIGLGGGLGWLSVRIEPLDEPMAGSSSSNGKDGGGGGSSSSNGGGGGAFQELDARDLYASIRQGTLTLEEPPSMEGGERQVVGLFPLTLFTCRGVRPAAFTHADVGRAVRITGDGAELQAARKAAGAAAAVATAVSKGLWIVGSDVSVEGEARRLAQSLTLVACDPRDVTKQMVAELVVTSVQDWVGGTVRLVQPGKRQGKREKEYTFTNVRAASLAASSHLVLEQRCTLLWEGRRVRRRPVRKDPSSGDGEQSGAARGLCASLIGCKRPGDAAGGDDGGGGWLPWYRHGGGGRRRKRRGASAEEASPDPIDEEAGQQQRSGVGGSESDGEGNGGLSSTHAHEEKGGGASAALFEHAGLVRQRLFIGPPDDPSHQAAARPSNVSLRKGPEFVGDLETLIREVLTESERIDAFHIDPHVAESVDRENDGIGGNRGGGARATTGPGGGGCSGGGSSKMSRQTTAGEKLEKQATDKRLTSEKNLARSSEAEAEAMRAENDAHRRGVIFEGFLLRKLHATTTWGRRHFTLYNHGRLRWDQGRGEEDEDDEETGDHDYGELTLRFFAVELCGQLSPLQLAEERFEDPELSLMLPSCIHFELKCGAEVLRLAWHKSGVDDWVRHLRRATVLNYHKAPLFSDKQLPVHWMDGEVRVLSIGENTTAGDLVRRLCHSRKRDDGNSIEPLITESNEWALFERQQHDDSSHVFGGGSSSSRGETDGPQLLKLPNGEPILNQLLLRWEQAARREYGCTPTPPRFAFELQMRKVKSSKGRVPSEEQRLEFYQAREDLLDGRLLTKLGRAETFEIAAVLALWEMHDRGPRAAASGKAAAIRDLLRQKHKNPTLDLDVLPEELHTVLPRDLWRSASICRVSHRELTKTYKALFKQAAGEEGFASKAFKDRAAEEAASRSNTYAYVQEVRSESRGVAFDAEGRVVVDQGMAARILCRRLRDEPLCFGALFAVRAWLGKSQPVHRLLVAINADGVHLYTWERQPRCLESFSFEWHSKSTLVAWQVIEHPDEKVAAAGTAGTDDAAGAAAAAAMPQSTPAKGGKGADAATADDAPPHTSFVLHVLTTPAETEAGPQGAAATAEGGGATAGAAEAAAAPAPQLTGRGGVNGKMRRGTLLRAQGGGGATPRSGRPGGRPMLGGAGGIDALSGGGAGGGPVPNMSPRERSKLVLLSSEGEEMRERLNEHANELVLIKRAQLRAAITGAAGAGGAGGKDASGRMTSRGHKGSVVAISRQVAALAERQHTGQETARGGPVRMSSFARGATTAR